MNTAGESLATPRPGYWQAVFSACAHDFASYLAFVNGNPPPEHIRVMIERLEYGDAWELFLGPPDTAKSETLRSWAAWTLGRCPSFRWLIASEIASGIATTDTTAIGDVIAANERYQAVFGELRDPNGKGEWSTQALRLRTYVSPRDSRRWRMPATPQPAPWLQEDRPHPPGVVPLQSRRGRIAGLTDPNVRAVGWRSGYTGARADGLIGDDLTSDKSARSQLITDTIWSTLHQKMLLRLTGHGPAYKRALIAGQIWAPRDIYALMRHHGVVVFDNNPDCQGLEVLEDFDGLEEAS